MKKFSSCFLVVAIVLNLQAVAHAELTGFEKLPNAKPIAIDAREYYRKFPSKTLPGFAAESIAYDVVDKAGQIQSCKVSDLLSRDAAIGVGTICLGAFCTFCAVAPASFGLPLTPPAITAAKVGLTLTLAGATILVSTVFMGPRGKITSPWLVIENLQSSQEADNVLLHIERIRLLKDLKQIEELRDFETRQRSIAGLAEVSPSWQSPLQVLSFWSAPETESRLRGRLIYNVLHSRDLILDEYDHSYLYESSYTHRVQQRSDELAKKIVEEAIQIDLSKMVKLKDAAQMREALVALYKRLSLTPIQYSNHENLKKQVITIFNNSLIQQFSADISAVKRNRSKLMNKEK